MNKKLFAVYLGGKADRCNIELHDVVFVVGTSIEETYPLLAQKWFGNMDGFHIDSYICLEHVDGYDILLTKHASEVDPAKKLFFINVGAYKPFEFTEYHQNAFYITENSAEAVERAKSELCQGLETIHKDDVVLLDRVNNDLEYDVDDVLQISEVDDYYITLVPSAVFKPCIPISKYIKLDMLAVN